MVAARMEPLKRRTDLQTVLGNQTMGRVTSINCQQSLTCFQHHARSRVTGTVTGARVSRNSVRCHWSADCATLQRRGRRRWR